jgi:tryptophan synthase alpha chain
MSSVDELFSSLRAARKKAFIPFITAGDPDLDFTRDLTIDLDQAGCHLCELGVPYSDPIADGPVIQASYTRALDKKVKLAEIFRSTKQISQSVKMPLIGMVSYAIVHRHGLEQYVADAREAGMSGAIVPDLLVEEAGGFSAICQRYDFSLVQLVTPTTPRERAIRIASLSSGFLYYVSVTGITGERRELPAELVDQVSWLREQTTLPICIGFGISQPEHVRLLSAVGDGVIVGSAIVKRMSQVEQKGSAAVRRDIVDYVTQLMSAL